MCAVSMEEGLRLRRFYTHSVGACVRVCLMDLAVHRTHYLFGPACLLDRPAGVGRTDSRREPVVIGGQAR